MRGKKARLLRKSRPVVAPMTEAEAELAESIATIRAERATALGEHGTKGRKKLDALIEKNRSKMRALQAEVDEASRTHADERAQIAYEYDLQIAVAQSERRALRKARHTPAEQADAVAA